MEWSQNYQNYQGYQDYQGYQGDSFRPLHQQRNFQQEMTSNNYQWSNERGMPKKASGTYDVDSITMLTEKVESLVKMLSNMSNLNSLSNPTLNDDFCGGVHMNANCINVEQAQFITNFNSHPQQSNPYSNTYNNE